MILSIINLNFISFTHDVHYRKMFNILIHAPLTISTQNYYKHTINKYFEVIIEQIFIHKL